MGKITIGGHRNKNAQESGGQQTRSTGANSRVEGETARMGNASGRGRSQKTDLSVQVMNWTDELTQFEYKVQERLSPFMTAYRENQMNEGIEKEVGYKWIALQNTLWGYYDRYKSQKLHMPMVSRRNMCAKLIDAFQCMTGYAATLVEHDRIGDYENEFLEEKIVELYDELSLL